MSYFLKKKDFSLRTPKFRPVKVEYKDETKGEEPIVEEKKKKTKKVVTDSEVTVENKEEKQD